MKRRNTADLRTEQARLTAEFEVLTAEVREAEKAARAALRAIAADKALDVIDLAEARKRRAEIEADLQAKRDRLAELEAALPEIERRAAQEELEAHRVEVKAAASELARSLKARHSASRTVARAVRDLQLQVDELRRHRAITESTESAYAALLGDDETFEWPGVVDEEWEADEALVSFLSDGPIRPLAAARAASAKAAAASERRDSELLGWVRQARQPADVRRRLAEALRDFDSDPDGDRARQFREAAEAHLASAEREMAKVRARREASKRERVTT